METLYTSDGCSYCGMSKDTVTTLRTELGLTTTFITKAEYDAWLLAHPSPF